MTCTRHWNGKCKGPGARGCRAIIEDQPVSTREADQGREAEGLGGGAGQHGGQRLGDVTGFSAESGTTSGAWQGAGTDTSDAISGPRGAGPGRATRWRPEPAGAHAPGCAAHTVRSRRRGGECEPRRPPAVGLRVPEPPFPGRARGGRTLLTAAGREGERVRDAGPKETLLRVTNMHSKQQKQNERGREAAQSLSSICSAGGRG